MGQSKRNQRRLKRENMMREASAEHRWRARLISIWSTLRCSSVVLALLVVSFSAVDVLGDIHIAEYEGRRIARVEVTFENSPPDPAAEAEFISLLRVVANTDFSTVRVRDSLQALFESGRAANARVEVFELGEDRTGPIRLRFVIQRQVLIGELRIDLATMTGTPVSEDELRARLILLQPGARFSRQLINRHADEIQVYLRDRGYFNASVEALEQIDPSGTRASITYRIVPGEQARLAAFTIEINGFDPAPVRPLMKLQSEAPFTREALAEDVKRIRDTIINQGFLAPQLEDARVVRDPESNRITVSIKGGIGPRVAVEVLNYEVSEKTAREVLPVMREGTLDYSAIVEGERRLRNRLQENGYFFTEITMACTVTPAPAELGSNGTNETCQSLNPQTLSGATIRIVYNVERGRRFRLSDIRVTGTNKIAYEDIQDELRSQKASALGLIPFFGYGRGYTSQALLEQDRRTVEAFMKDLGYRGAHAKVLQGVSLNGDNLIITFDVVEGPLTRIAGVEVRGNQIHTEQRIRDELKIVIGAPFSRSQARFDAERVRALYASEGYVNAQLEFSVVELPKKGEEELVRLIYSITNEGDKVFVNQILINGVTGDAETQFKKRQAILRAIPIAEGDVLRSARIADAERELYLTDAYRQVIIRSEPAGETAGGFKKNDIIIDVEEKKPRVIDYGGGFSTDTGVLGLLEVSHVNFMNRLRHAAMRLRGSKRKQRLRFEYFDPRFARYSEHQFAPLALSVEYQRDSTVTRFFRSAIDRGTMGIIQRLDENGNPIDEFGVNVGEPTINRFTVSAETQRVLDQKTRTIVFARYSYEDVRLFNLQSLLIKPILQPDRAIRLSRFGGSFVRDTRERCERALLGVRSIDEERPGAAGEVCRYNQVDATRGDFLTVDYAVALRQLGGSLSFNRFQANYRRYYKSPLLGGTVFAGNLTLGLANLFNPRDRDGTGTIDEIDLTLPISERFFSGGSTTLRGFRYEEAGPRQVIIPEGSFRDQNGNVVFLNPFIIPVGGNALAIVNLEARIPLGRSLQAVPFYDGGNVFRRIGDLFGKEDNTPLPPGDILAAINRANLRAHWTNTVGLGFRIQTPLGGALAVDYGFLLNPPEFLIPQKGPTGFDGTPAVYRLGRTQLHFRITQTF
jgi:outer membrane protein insertion porin family